MQLRTTQLGVWFVDKSSSKLVNEQSICPILLQALDRDAAVFHSPAAQARYDNADGGLTVATWDSYVEVIIGVQDAY